MIDDFILLGAISIVITLVMWRWTKLHDRITSRNKGHGVDE